MRCPPEIADVLLKLVELGILRIRAASGNPTRCFLEADHIHNLPGLIRDFSEASLHYYWQVERTSFGERISDLDRAPFEALWEELRHHAGSTVVTKSHGTALRVE